MGQQQLLLLILVTILVGIATVVAMNVFGTASADANRNAVRQDLLQGATAAQAIWARPAMLDGAGQDFSTESISHDEVLRLLGMPLEFTATVNEGSNQNGVYSITASDTLSLTLQGIPAQGGDNIYAVVCRDTDNNWQVDLADATAPAPCEVGLE